MTATQTRPAGRLSALLAGIRTAVDSHAGTTSSTGPDLHAARSSLARLPLLTAGETRGLR